VLCLLERQIQGLKAVSIELAGSGQVVVDALQCLGFPCGEGLVQIFGLFLEKFEVCPCGQ